MTMRSRIIALAIAGALALAPRVALSQGGQPAAGQLQIGQASGLPAWKTMSGSCTIAATGVISCAGGGTANFFATAPVNIGIVGSNVTYGLNFDATLANSGGNLGINLANANAWTAAQTFPASGIKLRGSSTGATTFVSANAGASNFTATAPAFSGTLAMLENPQTWTGIQFIPVAQQAVYDNSSYAASDGFVQTAIRAAMAAVPIPLSGGTYSFAGVGTQGLVTPGLAGGVITSLTAFPTPGTGWAVGDVLTVVGGNSDALIRVTAINGGGGVTAATILYGGTNYVACNCAFIAASGITAFTFDLSGVLTSNATIIMPNGSFLLGSDQWIFNNDTTGAFTVTVKLSNGSDAPTGTGVVLPQGTNHSTSSLLQTDGSDDIYPVVPTNGTVGQVSYAKSASVFGAISGVTTNGTSMTFANNAHVLAATGGGTTILNAAASASNFTATLPANTGTLAELNLPQAWTAVQTFNNGNAQLAGSSSGATTLSAPASGGGTATFFVGSDTVSGFSLANGGTNNALVASNGGVVYSDATKLNILAGTVTAGQCLLSGSTAAPVWGSCAGAAAVSSVSNSDTTLTISPTTGNVVASLNLAHANSWTANQTITGASFIMSGNISAAAWTTTGLRFKAGAAVLTDTSSSGTVATAYTNAVGAETIAASSVTTFTNYYGTYFVNPAAGGNVTLTNRYAVGGDSANFASLKVAGTNVLTSAVTSLVCNGGATTITTTGTCPSRQLLTGALTLYYRTDGNNACNGTVNAAGSSGNCAFADPGFCIAAISANYDRGGQVVTCQAGETVPKSFSPAAGGYVCNNPFTGGGLTIVKGNLGTATVTTPVASPGVVNWTAHGLTAGTPVYFTVSGGALPTGLTAATGMYYVIATGLTANAFQVSATVGGAAINFTGASTGTQTGNAITTLIDGTTNSTTGISIQGSCNLFVQNLRIKATVNNLECFGGAAGAGASGSISNVVFDGTPAGNDIYTNRNCNLEQDGADWVMGNAVSAHVQGGHGAEFRSVGVATNIVNGNKTYGSGGSAFAYASFLGRLVYTAGPTINLNGNTVTGQRCFAEINASVEQAGLGASFFPGNAICGSATGGVVTQ